MSILPRLVTVFDTNAYLGLNREAVDSVVTKERTAGVVGLASVWPCLELLSRCSSLDPGRLQRGWAALQKVMVHTGYSTPGGLRLRVHEAGEFTLARGLFGRTPDDSLLEIGFVGDLMAAAGTKPLGVFQSEHAGELRAISERVRLEEQHFLAMASKGREVGGATRIKQASPTQLDLALIAASMVQALAEKLGVELTPQNSERAVNLALGNFKVALSFMHGLISDQPTTEGVPGGGNSAWDLKIAFHASCGASVLGVPVQVVSDDRRLLRAAREAREGDRIVPLNDYLSLLDTPGGIKERAETLRPPE